MVIRGLHITYTACAAVGAAIRPLEIGAPPCDASIHTVDVLTAWGGLGGDFLQDSVELVEERRSICVRQGGWGRCV